MMHFLSGMFESQKRLHSLEWRSSSFFGTFSVITLVRRPKMVFESLHLRKKIRGSALPIVQK